MDNYKDTAYRMHKSSEILYSNGQWFNSNYLAGYVLECYCKLVLSYAHNKGDTLSSTIRKFGHDIRNMKDEIDLLSLRGGAASPYCIDVYNECNNILLNWNPNLRYECNTHLLNDNNVAADIKNEIDKLIKLISRMEADGVI